MRTTLRGTVAALALALAAAAPAAAQTLTFDDLPLAQPVSPLQPPTFTEPRRYGGLEFSGFFVGSDDMLSTGAGAVSGSQFAYIGHGLGTSPFLPEIFNPTRGFSGVSGYFGVRAAGPLSGPATITLRGFSALGDEVFTQALTLTATSTFFSVRTPVIDALEFDTSALDADVDAGAVVVLDDLAVSTVPEPGTIVLLATGLLAVGGVARVRRRNNSGGISAA